MCRVTLFDELTLQIGSGKIIEIDCCHPDVPADDTNLAHRAASLFQSKLNSAQGVNIHLNKKIPVADGLGGGSSYVALLSIFGFGTAVIPLVSLALNLLVTSVASYNFIRQRHALPRLIVPFLLTSLPMAYLGGALQVPVAVFHCVLLLSLCLVAVRIYFWKDTAFKVRAGRVGRLAIALFSGAVLGLAAGVVGIGGGIFLVPLIIVLGLGAVLAGLFVTGCSDDPGLWCHLHRTPRCRHI